MAEYPRGSEWRMWDLHVHTPDSIIQDYAALAEARWPRFLQELSELPSDIKVIGINDYWFLDGYKKVRSAKDKGQLPNIEEIFPVIELRCDTFSGSEGSLKRLNVHLILDPSEPIDNLEIQLRGILRANYRLTPDSDVLDWSEAPTLDSMSRLGAMIRDSTPPDKRTEFENKSDLEIGFNNLNVSFDALREGIEKNTYLRDRVVVTLGKVEWEKIKWNLASIANKKTHINRSHAVFTAAKTREAFAKSLESLKVASVNHRLLDCSDAHTWSDSKTSHMRLGACFTWVNADPTFKGLRQALQEYDHRVTAVERPAVLTRVAQSPRSVITRVRLDAVDGETKSPVFQSETLLNPGFVVVIGNKGQGKSALLDCIALAANSDRQEHFSFLNDQRFRSDSKVAASYRVGLDWADGSSSAALLHERFRPGEAIRADYLPQSLIEKVCSADPDSVTKREFETEIEHVIFRHIDDVMRGDATNLRQYLQEEAEPHQAAIRAARICIGDAANNLTTLRNRRQELESLQLESREQQLRQRLAGIEAELEIVTARISTGGGTEQQRQATELEEARNALVLAGNAVRERRDQIEAMSSSIAEVELRQSELVDDLNRLNSAAVELATAVDAPVDALFEATFEGSVVQNWIEGRRSARAELEEALSREGGLVDQLAVATLLAEEKAASLESVNDEVQLLLRTQSDLQAQCRDIEGQPGEPETIRGLQTLRSELVGIPQAMEDALQDLHRAFREVHTALAAIKDLQRDAYHPAMQFVDSNSLAAAVELEFDVEFRVRGFTDQWLPMVNRQRLGAFHDTAHPDRDARILGGVDLDDSEALLAALDDVVDRLSREGGAGNGERRLLDGIMRSNYSPGDLLAVIYGMEWLESQYIIRSAGSELSQLSPGQRGLVLLLFYLLVDKSERPLLLDQPEENLDNQTVRNVLVPALQEAVKHRQVIAVTHNPNFAVVGDADQIVVATYAEKFGYKSGSLAQIEIGQSTIDVLEGTREAFVNRNSKYNDVVGRS
ncbi:TrlF family AAA-like ATPase [Mycolicibacterium peregrinum]|uniref:TrlF family AAA-like ATPase n=1 Tax=Mycolicibacterium peregrinum TaxID=43304 RepID=UPI003AAC795B